MTVGWFAWEKNKILKKKKKVELSSDLISWFTIIELPSIFVLYNTNVYTQQSLLLWVCINKAIVAVKV